MWQRSSTTFSATIADREEQARGPGIDCLAEAERQQIHRERRSARVRDHGGDPDARPAANAFGDERGRIVTLAPPANHRPTKIRVIVAIRIAMARWSRERNSR